MAGTRIAGLFSVATLHSVIAEDVEQLETEGRNVLFDFIDVVFGNAHFFALLLLGRNCKYFKISFTYFFFFFTDFEGDSLP
jgi:hypothetical protein